MNIGDYYEQNLVSTLKHNKHYVQIREILPNKVVVCSIYCGKGSTSLREYGLEYFSIWFSQVSEEEVGMSLLANI